MCDSLCGERHQEDSPIDNMALFGGAHIRKGSGTIMLLYPKHINKHASIICMYIYYIWELSIFRDIEVCGFHSTCIYIFAKVLFAKEVEYVIVSKAH